MKAKDGQFKVTMEHPKASSPEPLVIIIDGSGTRVEKRFTPGAVMVTNQRTPRAG